MPTTTAAPILSDLAALLLHLSGGRLTRDEAAAAAAARTSAPDERDRTHTEKDCDEGCSCCFECYRRFGVSVCAALCPHSEASDGDAPGPR